MRRKIYYLLTLSALFYLISLNNLFSQNLPEKPVPPRLVNDFAGMLTRGEADRLETKLVAFSDSTSTQIAIVIVKSLDGYDKADYAQRLGQKWGIGQKGKDNGVIILIKPKTTDSRGEVQIDPGYGLEGVIPDIVCGEIVDYEILPAFRNGDYFGGLNKATSTLMSLAKGEFSAADYERKEAKGSSKGLPIGGFIIIVFIIIALISRNSGGNSRHIGTGGLPFWMLMGMMGSGRGSGGSWGGFSGGGGGGGGGFGGFGGGGFGGGGAGGSW